MPAEDEYSGAITGGLKLKGVNTSSKISKHKKKKKPKPEPDTEKRNNETAKRPDGDGAADRAVSRGKEEDDDDAMIRREEEEATPPQRAGKTEAELRHEERRRKRLDERLKREGTKTHKERVEELNRYLSNLSEHHDMPRIGPG